ncbi:hypothetical protein PARPLA_00509 [Rhodobacteraceae bacterium THAF1]|uniref:DUF3576 domain-containing protein n=1 Tax=Palleronia sp. THAF1 TaxID=2587842 RepID=UPI000F3F54A9|nr:DUF3576 domain-containing protein [Palleronia sp. THAF1]QFU09928.1 hypothetical protein FIU81_14715 [Palleronia sp. THAF1]VDC17169.1 hypothetical protein PARPLA_00509 [Rhodobacteraceae bacterium THAF1]
MQGSTPLRIVAALAAVAIVAGCGNREGNLAQREARANALGVNEERSTIFDLFLNVDDPNRTVEVNKYIWTAAQEVLDFLPLETADPFSGVLVYGYGTPPGGGQSYRATVFVQDPALDARSLNVAMATRSGPVTRATSQAIEDAILTRARQLRLGDDAL